MAGKRLQKKHLPAAINLLLKITGNTPLPESELAVALDFFRGGNPVQPYFYRYLKPGVELGYSKNARGVLYILTDSYTDFSEIRDRWQEEAPEYIRSQFTLHRVAGGREIFEATE